MTKPINEMNLEELAEYAVTLDGWEWMPGMVDSYGDIVVSSPSENWMYVCGRMYEDDTKREVAIGQEVQGTYPDLNDPATLGCVLAMARKRHGKYVTTMHRPQGWNVVDYRRLETVHIVESFDTWGFMPILAGEFKTEAHALIAALAKEVAR